jgi:isopentenyldiphosphate isomerase
LLDDDGEPTGATKARGLVHRDGDWHGALHIWAGGVDSDGESFVLFQRRSLTKDTWPGALDVAVGGHRRAGESLAETACEAEEEIGLRVGLDDLVRIGRRFVAGTARDGVIDREVQEVFAVRSDLPLGDYTLHPEEVDALVAVPIAGALRLYAGEVERVAARTCDQRGQASDVWLVYEDFAIRDRRYAAHALAALLAVLGGERPEPFLLRP